MSRVLYFEFSNYFSMKQANQVSLYITIYLWAIIIGAIFYSHIVFYSVYLSHLPESTSLLDGSYPIDDTNFWRVVVPVLLLSILATVMLNWRYASKRKYILIALAVYVAALIATVTYFVPEITALSKSRTLPGISRNNLLQRGNQWLFLSWVRAAFMLIGFYMLLRALRVSRHDERKRNKKQPGEK